MDTNVEKEVIAFLQRDIDTLIQNIGSYPSEGQEDLLHHTSGKDKLHGETWLQTHLDELRTIICNYQPLQKLLATDKWDAMQVIASIIDGINSTTWHNVPVTLIATYLFKVGIKNLCGDK